MSRESESTQRIAIENIVRRYLEQDEVWAGIEDWLTNVYEDPEPPVNDLLDRIAVIRPMPPLRPVTFQETAK